MCLRISYHECKMRRVVRLGFSVLVISCIIIVVVCVVWSGKNKRLSIETFNASIPKEIEQTVYGTYHPTPICEVLDKHTDNLDEQQGYVATSFVDTSRLRGGVPDKPNACYMLNDDGHNSVDPALEGRTCSKQDPLFQNRLVQNVYELNAKLPGETAPLKKCVVEFNQNADADAVGAFWNHWGNVTQTQGDELVRKSKAILQSRNANQAQNAAALRKDVSALQSSLDTCLSEVKACELKKTGLDGEIAAIVAKFGTCHQEREGTHTAYKVLFDQTTALQKELGQKLDVCKNQQSKADRALTACTEEVANLRANNTTLKGTVADLGKKRDACEVGLDACARDLAGTRTKYTLLDKDWKAVYERGKTCTRDLATCKQVHQDHVTQVTTPCQLELSAAKPKLADLLKELEACRLALRETSNDNIGLRNRLNKLLGEIKRLEPENQSLTGSLAHCRDALLGLQERLEECLRKSSANVRNMQDGHLSRLREMSRILLDKQTSTVGAYCKRPIIDPPAITDDDKNRLLSDIDECKRLLAEAMRDRDDWRNKYINEKAQHEFLKQAIVDAAAQRDFWRDRFFSRESCMHQHNLCEEGQCAPAPPVENPGGFEDWVRESIYYYSESESVKDNVFGKGTGVITPNPLNLDTIRSQLKPFIPPGPLSWLKVEGMGDGLLPSFSVDGNRVCIFYESPSFKVNTKVETKFGATLDDDLYIWVNNQSVMAVSWSGADADRNISPAYTFEPNTDYKIYYMWYNHKSEGYVKWWDGVKKLNDVLKAKGMEIKKSASSQFQSTISTNAQGEVTASWTASPEVLAQYGLGPLAGTSTGEQQVTSPDQQQATSTTDPAPAPVPDAINNLTTNAQTASVLNTMFGKFFR